MNEKTLETTLPFRFRIIRSFYDQDEIAKFVRVSRSNWSRWECGKSTPSLKYLERIAQFANVDLHWLITGGKASNPGTPPPLPPPKLKEKYDPWLGPPPGTEDPLYFTPEEIAKIKTGDTSWLEDMAKEQANK